jgi:hypothetical protein
MDVKVKHEHTKWVVVRNGEHDVVVFGDYYGDSIGRRQSGSHQWLTLRCRRHYLGCKFEAIVRVATILDAPKGRRSTR